jgi:hypothetical protein
MLKPAHVITATDGLSCTGDHTTRQPLDRPGRVRTHAWPLIILKMSLQGLL